MPTKKIVSIPLLILSIFLFSQGGLAQETPPADDTSTADNSIVCALLLEDTTDPLTEAIAAEQIALFGSAGGASDLPFSVSLPFAFLFEAYGLLTDSLADLDRTTEFLIDMSIAQCITQASALGMVDTLHTARGKIGYLRDNLEFVSAAVYVGQLEQSIALETGVLQTLIASQVVPDEPATSTTP